MGRLGDENARSDDGRALSPEELAIEDEESVVSLDDGRYVIGSDGESPSASPSRDESSAERSSSEREPSADSASRRGRTDVDARTVRRWLEDDLRSVESRYGLHITAKAGETASHQQLFSDDVGTVFDSLLTWYAQQLDRELPVEDVLGILLAASNVRVRYSPACLQRLLEACDLGPEDSIADLLSTVHADDGLVFPPREGGPNGDSER